MSEIVSVLRKFAFREEFYNSDTLLAVCLGCGEKAWLVEDIKHKEKCKVLPALTAAGILDKESTETVTQQLKAKIAALSKKLDKYNYYGAAYHIREIDEIVKGMRQLSAI